jgi:hypothetical protein
MTVIIGPSAWLGGPPSELLLRLLLLLLRRGEEGRGGAGRAAISLAVPLDHAEVGYGPVPDAESQPAHRRTVDSQPTPADLACCFQLRHRKSPRTLTAAQGNAVRCGAAQAAARLKLGQGGQTGRGTDGHTDKIDREGRTLCRCCSATAPPLERCTE